MRLLHIVGEMNPTLGGVGQAIRTIISGLEPLGIQNEVVSLDDSDNAFVSQEKFLLHALGPGLSSWSYSKKLKLWLLKNLTSYDVVILHGLWLYPGYAASLIIEELKKGKKIGKNSIEKLPQFFVMPHGMLDPYFQMASSRKLKAIRNKIYWELIENKVVNNAAALLFTCKEESKLARMPFHSYNPKREVIVGLSSEEPPAYIDSLREAFINKIPELGQNSYFLFLGRINEKKGVDLLIAAYKTIIEIQRDIEPEHLTNLRLKECNIQGFWETEVIPKLVIAGPGIETIYGQSLYKIVSNDPSLKNNVFFTGMLSGERKWSALYNCEAFILPSHQENFGIAVVEALACSKPVLISKKINIWREINESSAGIAKEDTFDGTLELFSSWLKTKEVEKLKMGLNARDCYEKKFTTSQTAKRIIKAITEK